MKFFTPQLLERYRSADPAVAQAAVAEWEVVHQEYEQHLRALEPTLPANVREFNALLLHDATVQTLARSPRRLLLVLKKDIPPRDLVLLHYDLEDEPVLVPYARNPREWQTPTRFDFDEFDRVEEAGRTWYTHAIVFDNGWELRLRFRDVQVTAAAFWPPTNGMTQGPFASPAVSETA
jgi:hypothetical protein